MITESTATGPARVSQRDCSSEPGMGAMRGSRDRAGSHRAHCRVRVLFFPKHVNEGCINESKQMLSEVPAVLWALRQGLRKNGNVWDGSGL